MSEQVKNIMIATGFSLFWVLIVSYAAFLPEIFPISTCDWNIGGKIYLALAIFAVDFGIEILCWKEVNAQSKDFITFFIIAFAVSFVFVKFSVDFDTKSVFSAFFIICVMGFTKGKLLYLKLKEKVEDIDVSISYLT